MKINSLHHRSGGLVTQISAVAHATYDGVASWHFIGDVRWNDGGQSVATEIAPNALCTDGTPESKAELDPLLEAMSAYLREHGDWHDPITKRDGRVFHWTPKQRAGQVPL